jgi:MinD superfamily P-loop ATPase
MKEVVILSGKGGTGKTSIVGSFVAIAENKVLDCCGRTERCETPPCATEGACRRG